MNMTAINQWWARTREENRRNHGLKNAHIGAIVILSVYLSALLLYAALKTAIG